MSIFKGTATALITPFNNDGIDEQALKNIIEYQIQKGINGIVVLGTTGEPCTISDEERITVIKKSKKFIKGRVPLIVGTGSNCTSHAVDLSIQAEQLGADALLIVTPYYNKCTQAGMVEHYSVISANVNIPIIAYSVPARTGVNILPETAAKLAEIENIAAIKEASGNLEQIEKMIKLVDGKIDIYSGDDEINVEIMQRGAIGVVSVFSNIMPKELVDMVNLCFDNKYEQALALQKQYAKLLAQLFIEVNPIPVKKAMELMGFCSNLIRLPLTELEDDHTKQLIEYMRPFNLIKE